LPKIYWRKRAQTKKWNKANLQKPVKLRQYRTSLYNKLKHLPEVDDVEEEWEGLKIAITEAANETIPTQNYLREMSGGMKNVGRLKKKKKKNEARSKWLQQKTRASYETYSTKRKEANN
jgi:hypothetical protein